MYTRGLIWIREPEAIVSADKTQTLPDKCQSVCVHSARQFSTVHNFKASVLYCCCFEMTIYHAEVSDRSCRRMLCC